MNQNGSNDQNGFGGQTNQSGYSGQYDSTYQYGSGSQFNGQHGGNNNYGQNNMIYQNYANGQHGYNGYYGSYVDRMDKEHQNFIKETSEVKDLFMEMTVSNELLIQHLREISLRLAIEKQVLSQQVEGQTLNPNLDSQSQEENSHVVASWPPIPPTPIEESEVSKEYKSEKEMGEMTLGSNVQVDCPIESLTLVEEKDEEGGRSTTQGGIIIDMIVGEKFDIVRPQLQVVKFIEPQPKAKIGRPSGLGGHEGSAKVMARSHLGSASHPSISTHRQQNGKIRVESKKSSKLGVKYVAGGPLFRPNHATSLEIQQLIHAMKMSNNLNHQRIQEATQTIPQTMNT
ncbi:unnamed protein product [Prunus brigantina]